MIYKWLLKAPRNLRTLKFFLFNQKREKKRAYAEESQAPGVDFCLQAFAWCSASGRGWKEEGKKTAGKILFLLEETEALLFVFLTLAWAGLSTHAYRGGQGLGASRGRSAMAADLGGCLAWDRLDPWVHLLLSEKRDVKGVTQFQCLYSFSASNRNILIILNENKM